MADFYAMKTRIKRMLAYEAEQQNPVLGDGEPLYESDTGGLKIGNGNSRYNELKYTGIVVTSGQLKLTGIVDTWEQLPAASSSKNGDVYLVREDGKMYTFVGSAWQPKGSGTTIKGDKGETGERGPTGLQGEKGDRGDIGPKGDQGQPGLQGAKGDRGDTGLQGQQGLKGDVGSRGDTGPRGLQGEQGVQGPKGDQGIQGEQGQRGDGLELEYQVGTYAELILLPGQSGFSGIVFADAMIYFWIEGAWQPEGTGVPITGAQGERGEKGDRGDPGPQGIQGIQGLQGPKGDTGTAGTNGAKGDKGDAGSKGDVGEVGPKGDQGEQGIQGPKGDQGIQGPKGDTGAKGDKGDAGASGASNWDEIAGKPTTFPPSTHTHELELSDVNGLVPELQSLYGLLGMLDPPKPKVSRTLAYTNGGQGGGVAYPTPLSGTLTQLGLRHVVKVDEETIRWRVKLRNWRAFDNTAGTTALSGQGIIFGLQENTAGANTGNFKDGVASTIASGGFTVPNSTSFYTSPWVTDPSLQLQPGVKYVVAWGFTCSAQSLASGANESFQFTTSSAGLNPATTGGVAGAGNTYRGTPIDFQIEYEVSTKKKAFLWLGDSISEGATGVVGTSYPTTCRPCPVYESYPARWASANDFLLQNIAQSNLYAREWAVTSADRWNRTDLAAAKFDGVFIAAGSNDYANNRTLAQFQADIQTIITKVRDVVGLKPIYLVDIMPRTDASAREALRTSFNSWLYTLPYGVRGVVRASDVFAATPGASTVIPAMTCDGVHPSFDGILALADKTTLYVPNSN